MPVFGYVFINNRSTSRGFLEEHELRSLAINPNAVDAIVESARDPIPGEDWERVVVSISLRRGSKLHIPFAHPQGSQDPLCMVVDKLEQATLDRECRECIKQILADADDRSGV